MSDHLEMLKAIKSNADKAAGFKEKFLQVLVAKRFSEADIEEAKQCVIEAWNIAKETGDSYLKECWINWINEEAKIWR